MYTQLWEAQGNSPMEMEADHLQFPFLIQDLPGLKHTENSCQTLTRMNKVSSQNQPECTYLDSSGSSPGLNNLWMTTGNSL